MSDKNTGGPAFPEQRQQLNDYGKPIGEPRTISGMTLRDYFAAKVMHQILNGAVLPTPEDRERFFPMVADVAYQMSDAMLKARES